MKPKEYKSIAKILENDYPHVHREISNKVLPKRSDMENIPKMHSEFMDVFDSKGNQKAMDLKFICVVLYLYSPDTLFTDTSCNSGIVHWLNKVLKQKHKCDVSKKITQARNNYVREGYKKEVDMIVNLMK